MIRHMAIAAVTAAVLGSAGAGHAALAFSSATGDFRNPAGASVFTLEDNDGLTGAEVFRYGEIGLPGTTVQSFLSFSSAAAAPVNAGETFTLGSLMYQNGANAGNAEVVTVAFDVSAALTLDGAPLTGVAGYLFTINNTPNGEPCPYPSTTPCADLVTIQSLDSFQTFTVNGQTLRLYIDGFRDAQGAIRTSFLGEEDSVTSATLVGRFDLVAAGVVPEPNSWALMILGFGLLGAGLRRKPLALG